MKPEIIAVYKEFLDEDHIIERADIAYRDAKTVLERRNIEPSEEDIWEFCKVLVNYREGKLLDISSRLRFCLSGYFISAMTNNLMERKDTELALPLQNVGGFLEGVCYGLSRGKVICLGGSLQDFGAGQMGGDAILTGSASGSV